MEYFKNKGFLEAVITIFVSLLASLSVVILNGYSIDNISELFNEYFKLLIIVICAVIIFVLIGIKAKEEQKEEQKNEEKIRNMLNEELAKLINQDNNLK